MLFGVGRRLLHKRLACDDAIGDLCLEDGAGRNVGCRADDVPCGVGRQRVTHVENAFGAGHLEGVLDEFKTMTLPLQSMACGGSQLLGEGCEAVALAVNLLAGVDFKPAGKAQEMFALAAGEGGCCALEAVSNAFETLALLVE